MVAAVSAIITVVLTTPEVRYEWLVVLCGMNLTVTFVLQLGTAQRDGFITRVSASSVGSLIIIGVVQLIAFFLGQG